MSKKSINYITKKLPETNLMECFKFLNLADFIVLVFVCQIFKQLINHDYLKKTRREVFFSAFPYLLGDKRIAEISDQSFAGLGRMFHSVFQDFQKEIVNYPLNQGESVSNIKEEDDKNTVIMKITWLAEIGHLKGALQYIRSNHTQKRLVTAWGFPLWYRNFKGHPLTRIIKQYLPVIDFKGFPIQKLGVPQLNKEVKPFKNLLDFIFKNTLSSKFWSIDKDFKNIPEKIMQASLQNKQRPDVNLIRLYVISFACYQFELCNEIFDFSVKNEVALNFPELFFNIGSSYGEKNITHSCLQLMNKTKSNELINTHFFRSSFPEIDDIELIKLFIASSLDFSQMSQRFQTPLYHCLVNSKNPLITALILDLDQKSIIYDNNLMLTIIRKLTYLENNRDKVVRYLDLLKKEKNFDNFFPLVQSFISSQDFINQSLPIDKEELIILLLENSIKCDLEISFTLKYIFDEVDIHLTLAQAAALLGLPKILNYLIQKNVKQLDLALQWAVKACGILNNSKKARGHEECIRLLKATQALTNSNFGMLTPSNSHSTSSHHTTQTPAGNII